MSSSSESPKGLPVTAKVFIVLVVSGGASVLAWAAAHPVSRDTPQFVCYFVIALLASLLKVHLPGITGTMSVNFLFILLGVFEFSLSETLLLGCGALLVQCFYRDRPRLVQVAFNIGAGALAIGATYGAYHFALRKWMLESNALLLALAASTYFVANTGSIAAVISLTESKPLRKTWVECYFWSFPYYLLGAAVAGVMGWVNRKFGWQTSLLVLPVIYLIYRSYSLYLGKLQGEKHHAQQVANLHMRTIEALALAIEAKDHKTHDHLQRVRIYAVEVAKELKVSHEEVEALRAAALLHDIGKLAVPEHIISKPGRLTPEEFEKIKIHPIIGAEILERVRFPYPVVPIVRAHHEKWDGSGYPFGLKGTEIPIGARVLSAVDYLDALASDRQYRPAIPLEKVIQSLQQESGKAFDPKVVDVLQTNYLRLEKLVQTQFSNGKPSKLSTDMKIDRGIAPAAGFEEMSIKRGTAGEVTFLTFIAAARQEAQTLFELSQDLGASLSLGETLSVFSVKLRRLVPYDSIVIYIRRGDDLVPEHASGDNFRLFNSLRIPIGQGLSGWVADNRKSIINGNPMVEPGYRNEPNSVPLHSALSLPLEGVSGVVGVLTLYQSATNAFTSDHLRILQAVSSKMGLAIENALKYQQAESSATTDFLTNLPNARSLFLQLEHELARCKRENVCLTVMVCDMDGFKSINDRFGHLEGNRVLRLFAQGLKQSCRPYDYVARMGGDEFVVITPGLPVEAIASKIEQLKQLAARAGSEICGEDVVSLSVGTAAYPQDGDGAERLLAIADRQMYQEKQGQPSHNNRRLYPRIRCRLTIELVPRTSPSPVVGTLIDISLGGAYVETSAVLPIETAAELVVQTDREKVEVQSIVVRVAPGSGVAIRFMNNDPEDKERIQRILAMAFEARTLPRQVPLADAQKN